MKWQLDKDVRCRVWRQFPVGEATEWCVQMVVTAMKNGQPCQTVDYQCLNAACLREMHHTPAPFNMMFNMPLRSFNTVAHAFFGFHQVELDKDSSRLTIFISFDEAIVGMKCKHKRMENTLLYDGSVGQAFWHTYMWVKMVSL